MKVPDGVRKPPGTLLVLNGAGGVGSMLIQLANRLTSLTVIATASRPESVEWVRKLGAKHVADHSKPIDEALHAIGFSGVDGGFKSEAQQGVDEWKLRIPKRLQAYVRRPRMANEMHG
jgi:NADPH:quinone reductase-like Zn-dependent oxidoreductase